jgi:hypothetical protein
MDISRQAVCITPLFYTFTSNPPPFNTLNCETRTDLLTSLLPLPCFNGYCGVWVVISALHFFSIETRYTNKRHWSSVKMCIAALFDIPLLCFSDKVDQDISDKIFKCPVRKICKTVNLWSSQHVPELRSGALRRRTFPIHIYIYIYIYTQNRFGGKLSGSLRAAVRSGMRFSCDSVWAHYGRPYTTPFVAYLLVCARIHRGQLVIYNVLFSFVSLREDCATAEIL